MRWNIGLNGITETIEVKDVTARRNHDTSVVMTFCANTDGALVLVGSRRITETFEKGVGGSATYEAGQSNEGGCIGRHYRKECDDSCLIRQNVGAR